jgi:type I pantothenate kinase
VLIFEGLNVLQGSDDAGVVASDFFDFSIYLDAEASDVERWYIERFSVLQRTAFQRPTSYFHHFKDLDPAQTRRAGRDIWQGINLPNLLRNIQPTRERASLILRKGRSHAVEEALWRHALPPAKARVSRKEPLGSRSQ